MFTLIIFWYEGQAFYLYEQKMTIFKTLYLINIESCEAMTSSTCYFEYSRGLVQKCFAKKYEISKFPNFLITYPIFIIFALFCGESFYPFF